MINKNTKNLFLSFLLFASIPSFAVDKVVDGGPGTNTLRITPSGITGLSDFDISISSDSIVLTDSSSNTISFRRISNLIVGNYSYLRVQTNKASSPEDEEAYWNATEQALYLFGESNLSSDCLLYTSPSPRDKRQSRMPSSA